MFPAGTQLVEARSRWESAERWGGSPARVEFTSRAETEGRPFPAADPLDRGLDSSAASMTRSAEGILSDVGGKVAQEEGKPRSRSPTICFGGCGTIQRALVVLDAWRSLTDQQRLLDYYKRSGPTRGFVAEVGLQSIRPPHVTGGAVDLTLSHLGVPLALGTQFDSFTKLANLHFFEVEDGLIRRLRRSLAAAMSNAGFVPYPPEWWHWSYGDDVWAAANSCAARYDLAEEL